MLEDDRFSLESLRQFHEVTNLIPRMTAAIDLQERILHAPGQESDVSLLAAKLSASERSDINYSALIITLYGAVERFAEDFTKELARCTAASAHNKGQLSDKINDEHLMRSIKYIDHLRSQKTEPVESVAIVLSRLAACMSGHSFELNTEAYGLHTANIRQKSLTEMLKPLGLQDAVTKAIGNENFQAILEEKGRTEKGMTFHLDDLADRRNAVAHGREIDDRLQVELFVEYAEVLSVFTDSLVDAAVLLLANNAKPQTAASLGVPTQKAQSGKIIVCCPVEDIYLRRGHRIMWKTADGTPHVAKVKNLQVDHLDVQDGNFTAHCDIGLQLDRNYTGRLSPDAEHPVLILTRR